LCGFAGIFSALAIPRSKRSSAPGSSLGGFSVMAEYPLSVSDEHLRMVGRLCVLQGHIEFYMVGTFTWAAPSMNEALARKILGSTNLLVNFDIWLDTLYQNRFLNPKIPLDWAEIAVEQASDLISGRNDFVHGVFGYENRVEGIPDPIFTVAPLSGHPHRQVAMRVKSGAQAELSALSDVLQRATELARIMAFIYGRAGSGLPAWLGTLGPAPPPRSEKARVRLAQARAAPRRPLQE
jgi:hypothetical protein